MERTNKLGGLILTERPSMIWGHQWWMKLAISLVNFLISVSKAMKVSKSTVKTYDNKCVPTIRLNPVKDVRAHCYCASLVRTLYMTWRLLRHVFQARAPSQNSTKYRADELCGNLISEYFCWMLGDPHFFFSADHFLFWFFLLYQKTKKIFALEVLIISHILFK